MQASRNLHRHRAIKFAKVNLDASGIYVDCRIRDLHSLGARLKFEGAMPSSGRIEFILMPENVRVLGKKAWQHENEIGVSFDHALKHLEKNDVACLARNDNNPRNA